MDILLLIAGLALLIVGGEVLVRSSAGVALKSNIPPLIVGLTIVSIGTSAPELFASMSAALKDAPGLAIGNVVGSNIANIALVLGITALIYPIPIFRSMLYFDVVAMLLVSLLLIFLAQDSMISRIDGVILLVFIVVFIVSLIIRSQRRKGSKRGEAANSINDEVEDLKGFAKKGYLFLSTMILVGCVGLYFGAEWFVEGATGIARRLSIDEYIIGLTVVAFGTSVPELAASVIAALRQQTDISIGNLIGSNIFNIGLVLGTTSVVKPLAVDARIISSDLWWMLGVALLLFPIMLTGYRIRRIEGFLLTAVYGCYLYVAIT